MSCTVEILFVPLHRRNRLNDRFMQKDKRIQWFGALVIACALSLTITSITSCDTPQTIAWSYYYCAQDTLAAGDPFAAKDFLEACKKSVDDELRQKADSLMEVIERAIEEKK